MAAAKKNNFTREKLGQSVLLCLLVALEGSQCSFVQLFQNADYSGLLKEIELKDAYCVNTEFPAGSQSVGSLKTDTCLMVYNTSGCFLGDSKTKPKFATLSFRVEKDEPNLSSVYSHTKSFPSVASFQACNEVIGGFDRANVAFASEVDYEGLPLMYTNVCGCRNIPYYLKWGKTKQISVINMGYGLELFSGEHCTGTSKILPAGFSMESRALWPERDFDVRSFRYASLYKCLKMDGTVTEFRFTNNSQTTSGVEGLSQFTENVQLATSSKMRNNKAAKITQEYVISEKVTNTLDIGLSHSMSSMHQLGFSLGFKISGSMGVKGILEGELGTKFGLNYAHKWGNTLTNTSKKITTNEQSISTRQVIEVPSCKECTASSYLQKVKGFPIPYEAYVKVNASDFGRRLEAREVRALLPPGMDYVRDYDQFTVETMSKSTMLASFAMDAFINVDCVTIPDCNHSNSG